MFLKVIITLLLTVFGQDATYYVSTTGKDSTTCGTEAVPCATINQVITNYPKDSYTVSIAAGIYSMSQIVLQGNAFVVFQGNGNPTVVASWDSSSFIMNTNTSGFEFRDLSLNLSTNSDMDFSMLNRGANTAGFYNIALTCSSSAYEYIYSDFIHMNAGSLVISNITFSQAIFYTNFIMSYGNYEGNYEDSNVIITGSIFTNFTFLENGGLLRSECEGNSKILLNSTSFNGNSAQDVFISVKAWGGDQILTVSNNVFNNINTFAPSLYVENDYEITINIQNSTWNNITASSSFSGAVGILGADDGSDYEITLNNLTFTNCVGVYAGALLVGYNSLNLSNAIFANNTYSEGGKYGNDVVQALDDGSASFKCNITHSYSSSALPKAVIWNVSSDDVTDISGQLPNPSRVSAIRHLRHQDVSASTNFGRKVRKNFNE